jgi:site-specific recombinase XerD
MAVDMLTECVDRSTIALWLGHQHVQTTQIYLDATLAMKEKALGKVAPRQSRPSRYQPDDRLLAFLTNL